MGAGSCRLWHMLPGSCLVPPDLYSIWYVMTSFGKHLPSLGHMQKLYTHTYRVNIPMRDPPSRTYSVSEKCLPSSPLKWDNLRHIQSHLQRPLESQTSGLWSDLLTIALGIDFFHSSIAVQWTSPAGQDWQQQLYIHSKAEEFRQDSTGSFAGLAGLSLGCT